MATKPKQEWMSETAVARHFGFRNPDYIRGWGIPHLSVKTKKGRIVRRYKQADVLAFEQTHYQERLAS